MSHNSGVPEKKVFISYSHADGVWLDRLKTHLTPLIRGTEIILWDDTKIQAGSKWKEEIRDALDGAFAAVLLVTQEFLASEFIHKHELPAIYEAARSRGLHFLWIPVKTSSVATTPVWDYEALHDPRKPLESLKGDARTKALVDIAEKIANAINGPAGKDNPESYLRWLWGKTQLIDLEHFRPPGGTVRQFYIDRLYTKLTMVIVGERQERLAEFESPMKTGDRFLHQALKDHQWLVLVGDPGAGKTTFLRRIAFELCHVRLGWDREADGENCRAIERLVNIGEEAFPVLLDARSLASHIWSGGVAHSGALADTASPAWLFHYLGATHATHGLPTSYFVNQAEHGCILLVDAFDEVPDPNHRRELGRLLRNLAQDRRYGKTRIVGTSRPGEHGGLTGIEGFETAQVAPLGEGERAAFIRHWGDALYPSRPGDAATFVRTLSEEIQRPQVGILARNPMMLTALAVLHFVEGRKLPEQRSKLYSYILQWLAERRAAKTQDGGGGPEDFLFKMRLIAMRMSTGQEQMRAELSLEEAIDVVEEDFQGPQYRDPERRRNAARDFLIAEQTKSGVIIEDGLNIRFWHLTFREALAAQELAKSERKWRHWLFEKDRLYQGLWRETILLLAGELKSSGGHREVNALLGEMLHRAEAAGADLTEKARCIGLMGLLLKDLEAWKYVMADEMAVRHRALRDEVMAIFDKEKAYGIPFAVRLDAAHALGLAGDPRLDRDNFVRIEGGTFLMGADDNNPGRKETVQPFFIGCYLVTVAEYQCFVEAKGYSIEDYWKAGGFGKFTEPGKWAAQLEEPKNRPVVGVSWYEASAYCAWNKGRLPREKEWEFAARANREGVKHPWGNDEPNERFANFAYKDSPRKPTPVGLYPAGATPTGLHDMAGNVWEWVEDQGADDPDIRVLRGGGWNLSAWNLRVSNRNWDDRAVRYDDFGFRCVREVVSL